MASSRSIVDAGDDKPDQLPRRDDNRECESIDLDCAITSRFGHDDYSIKEDYSIFDQKSVRDIEKQLFDITGSKLPSDKSGLTAADSYSVFSAQTSHVDGYSLSGTEGSVYTTEETMVMDDKHHRGIFLKKTENEELLEEAAKAETAILQAKEMLSCPRPGLVRIEEVAKAETAILQAKEMVSCPRPGMVQRRVPSSMPELPHGHDNDEGVEEATSRQAKELASYQRPRMPEPPHDYGLDEVVLRQHKVHGGEFCHIEEEKLAVATAIEEELGEGNQGCNVQQAEAMEVSTKAQSDKKNRQYGLGICLLVVLVVAGLILGVVILPSLQGLDDTYEGPPLMASGATDAPTTYRESLGIQEKLASFMGDSKLANVTTSHYEALQWLLHDDPLQLTPTSTNLLQRYILTLFYYKTSVQGPWRSCNPAELENETDACDFLVLKYTYPELAFNPVNSHRWLSGAHECDWAGIECEEDVVVTINLAGNKLSGGLPASLGLLSQLSTLSFTANELTGTLPATLAMEMQDRARNIELLDNLFSGTIPKEWFQFKKIGRINLSGNPFITGTIPTEIGQLGHDPTWDSSQGVGIFLFENPGLTGSLPSEIGNLENLHYLRISKTSISGMIPTELGKLTALSEIWSHKTNINGTIPSEIGQLTELRDFRLQHTNISGTIPKELYDLPLLSVLRLQDTALTGTIPGEMCDINDLNFDCSPSLCGCYCPCL